MSHQNKGGAHRAAAQGAGPRTGAAPGARSSPPKHAPRVPAWTAAQWAAALPPALASLGLTLDAGQQQRLVDYMVMLSHWNATYNLTALRAPEDMLSHHLLDCLAVLAPLARQLSQMGQGAVAKGALGAAAPQSAAAPQPLRLLDVGSGGGLPGVVLAICQPGVQVTCVDTVGKKAAFIRQVAAELKLPNLRAEHARVEQLKARYDVITSRAFASLLDFVTLTKDLLADDAVWMAMKGKAPDEELAVLPANVNVFHVEQLTVPGLDAERCLVWMRQR
jgi:16S rRNA (guanine527-N7)-methyltransferase